MIKDEANDALPTGIAESKSTSHHDSNSLSIKRVSAAHALCQNIPAKKNVKRNPTRVSSKNL